MHTSTVTVAVLKRADATSQSGDLLDDDIEVEWYSGSGAGGQHRNKHQNSVRLRHRATGIVKTAQKRSREASLKEARKALEQEIQNLKSAHAAERMNSNRRNQVGSGMRGDKCRTYRFQDDIVVDDVTGKRAKASGVMRGGFQALWR